MEKVLEFKDISYYYESGERKISILEHADCSFEKGKRYTIVGPSGSGKTTTLTLAGALEAPKEGTVLFDGQDLKEIGYNTYRNSKIGIVFQSYNLLSYLTPYQNVLAAMEITKNPIENKKQRAEELLLRMGLTKVQMHRGINKLSGGEQKHTQCARRACPGSGPPVILWQIQRFFSKAAKKNLNPHGTLEMSFFSRKVMTSSAMAANSWEWVTAITHFPWLWASCRKISMISGGVDIQVPGGLIGQQKFWE